MVFAGGVNVNVAKVGILKKMNDSSIIVVCTDRCGHLRHSRQRLAAVAAVATRRKASTKKIHTFSQQAYMYFFRGVAPRQENMFYVINSIRI